MPQVPITQSAADAILEEYGHKIIALSEKNNIDFISNKIWIIANQMQQVALEAYRSLGFKGNSLFEIEKQASIRIKQLQSETLNLNGINLEKVFLESFRKAVVYEEKPLRTQQEYEKFLQYIENETKKDFDRKSDDFAKAAMAVLYNESIESSSGYNINKGSISKPGKFLGKFSTIFAELSAKLKDKVNQWFLAQEGNSRQVTVTTETTNNDTEMSTEFKIEHPYTVQSYLRMANDEGQRDRFLEQHPDAEEKIFKEFIQLIKNNCGMVKNQVYFDQALREVFEGNKGMFIGGNIKNITGKLGEVQALYYLKVLTDNGANGSMPQWLGGIGNPHQDLVLRKGLENFGLQVKNTSRKISNYIVDFQDFGVTKNSFEKYKDEAISSLKQVDFNYTENAIKNFNNIVSSLYGGININSTDISEGMTTIFSMYSFNIGYYWHNIKKNRYYKDPNNPDFKKTRNKIEELTKKANQVLSLMSVMAMYMQGVDDMQKDKNTIFIIGGTTIISAATILYNIAAELKDITLDYNDYSFKISSANTSTIVDVLNSKTQLASLNFSLKSSYNFILN